MSSVREQELARRRTFAIISHPDAGKTTLTEKFLLFGGALQLAGAVRAKAHQRRTKSDWMKIEQQRGISVMTSVMTFTYLDYVFNMLDTPGHEDFSEDTYRTLSAVDSAVMVIDAAKGIEARTLKLFEVCRLRDIPIITFINKVDLESREPFSLIDEIEKALALDLVPLNWPIGCGHSLAGLYDLVNDEIYRCVDQKTLKVSGAVGSSLQELLKEGAEAEREDISLARDMSRSFDLKAYREGFMSPVFFGSALKDIGVRDLIDAIIKFAPSPRSYMSDKRIVEPGEPGMTGFIFRIQANMDRNHRDRIAFMRVTSGVLERGMKAKVTRTGKPVSLRAPQFFFARERRVVEEAFAGDVVGIPNHGSLRIGDTLTGGEEIKFHGVPSFVPERLCRVSLGDAMLAKKMQEAIRQLAEEGVVQVFNPLDGSPPLIGVVGPLQLDVLIARMASEYNLPIKLEASRFQVMRWIFSSNQNLLDQFMKSHHSSIAEDLDGIPVFMAASGFILNYEIEAQSPGIQFHDVKTYQGFPGKKL
ncbi:MAG: peptide chain release factor 3 [Alphaproteobacteria bacterium]|nr:peptide chain release factor 3 [Alphaproteobacteria bacterium]